MMFKSNRLIASGVVAAAATLLLAACGGAGGDSANSGDPVGDPVSGGTGTYLIVSEPRSLDPAAMANSATSGGVLGNALYGTLITNDVDSGAPKFQMAESFESSDGGATFEMKLRPGLVFSDGSPLDAEAVKFNWDRIKDPATGSLSIRDAAAIDSTTVVDPTTLTVVMKSPVPRYAQNIVASGMNWIASPAALQQGQQSFDLNPIGAGPFTLESWTRQAQIEMVKNPTFWDAPKPYLDGITFRVVSDTSQRQNTMMSGGGDLATITSPSVVSTMESNGMKTFVSPTSGGLMITMNTRRAPFDDIRAREAVSYALDLEAINAAVFEGKGDIAKTLFVETSPFYEDIPLQTTNKEAAQERFDELAAEGKPVSFTFTAYNTMESKPVAEAVQAALSAYKNVDVQVKTVEVSEIPSLYATNDYDMVISSAKLIDPEPQLWTTFAGASTSNRSGIDDPELNAALDTGRLSSDEGERKEAYKVAQERLAALVPSVFYSRAVDGVAFAPNVHGVETYGFGSVLPEHLWIQK